MTRITIAALVLAIPILPPSVAAAEDSELWLELGARHELVRDLEVGLSGQLKLDQDMSRVQSILPQVEASYHVLPWLSLTAGYRFNFERDTLGDLEPGHRVFVGGSLHVPLAAVRLAYRARFQDEWSWDIDGQIENKPTLRNLAGITYRGFKKVRPTVSAEHFLALEALDTQPTRKWRFTAGAAIKVKKLVELEPFYRLELADNAAEVTHIVGLSILSELWDD